MLLEEFRLKHTIVPGEKPSSDFILRFQSLLPEYLIQVWKEFGLFRTEDTFFFLTNPDDFEFLYEEKILKREQIVFARTSFGDLFLWDKDFRNHYMVNEGVLFGEKSGGSQNIMLFFESAMYMDQFLDGVINQKAHKKAIKKLGLLKPDECFAFVPAFALGGSARTSEVEKVKLREHLIFLSQLTGAPQNVNTSVSSNAIDNLIDVYDRSNP